MTPPPPGSARKLVLAVETSTRSGSLALRAGSALHEVRLSEGRSHAADLLPKLQGLLLQAGVAPEAGSRALAAVVVGTGPGSYTGLRVGIATALGLARAAGALAMGVPSIDALAFGELEVGEEGSVLLDARAGRVYHARYRREEHDVVVLLAPAALRLAELDQRLRPAERVLGGGPAIEELAREPAFRARLRLVVPGARALLAIGQGRLERGAPGSLEIEPLYLMAPPARATPPRS